jgi:hypothetical protein
MAPSSGIKKREWLFCIALGIVLGLMGAYLIAIAGFGWLVKETVNGLLE